MSTFRRLLVLGFCLSLMLVACSQATPAATSVSSAPTSALQLTLPQATVAPTSEPVSVGVPVIEFHSDEGELVVISSVTGKRLDSFVPIPIGDFYSYVFAPDGHTLALVANAKLYLIALPSWKTREYDLGLHGWMSSMVYRSDGTLLALATGEPESALWIINPKSGEITANRKADFSIRTVQFSADGSALLAYGPHIANTGVAANAGVSVGAPKAALYTVSDLSLLWSAELDGIRDGTFPKKEDIANTQDIYLPGAALHYEPGIAFSPNDDILYLVHGDEDKLTKVDFIERKVNTMDVHVKTSWLDQLLSLTAGVAHAKGMDGTIKKAFISPDGKFLFVGGNTEAVTQPANSIDWNITDTPLGLQVIAVEDGTLVAEIDLEITLTGVSSDGKQIFFAGWKKDDSYAIPWTDIYDASSRSLVKHIDHVYLMPTRRIDGRPILVSTEYVGNNGDNVCNMASVDPAIWIVTSRWKGHCVVWLTTP